MPFTYPPKRSIPKNLKVWGTPIRREVVHPVSISEKKT